MKDVKTFIESGVLEAYVLGNASAEEADAVEYMVEHHAEVEAELVAIAHAVEIYVSAFTLAPDADLKAAIFSSLSLID